MKNKILFGLAITICCIWQTGNAQSPAPKLLPFQGRLTDQNGVAVSNGVRLVQFKIYDVPTGGSPVWAGELHRTTVNGGLVNVMLGSKTPFSGVDFDRQLYLEITVDINADSAITVADPPMLPRQVILPVLFAKEAADSRLLDGHDWSAIMADRNPNPENGIIAETKLPTGVAVPIGGILMWWGSTTNVPQGFEICDGLLPATAGALLTGNKPDLRGRFPMGAQIGTDDVKTPPIIGGTNYIAARVSGETNLTINQLPSHDHSVSLTTSAVGDHSHPIATQQNGNQGTYGLLAGDLSGYSGAHSRATGNGGAHSHAVSGVTGSVGGGQGHIHIIPPHDNRPAYAEVFFIIRVK